MKGILFAESSMQSGDIIFKLAAPHTQSEMRVRERQSARVSLFIIIRGYLKDAIKI